MSNLPPPAATSKSRRLNFAKPDPNPVDPILARAKRKASPEPHKTKPNRRPRLPHGARYDHLVFDAENAWWTGRLTVEGETFESKASAAMYLLGKLDDLYRAWVAEGRPARKASAG